MGSKASKSQTLQAPQAPQPPQPPIVQQPPRPAPPQRRMEEIPAVQAVPITSQSIRRLLQKDPISSLESTINLLSPPIPTQPVHTSTSTNSNAHTPVTSTRIEAALQELRSEDHYIVVLGVPTLPNGEPSQGMKLRISKAFSEYQRQKYNNLIPTVICSGSSVQNRFSESITIRNELIKLGIDEKVIWVENQARTTLDNASFTFRLLHDHYRRDEVHAEGEGRQTRKIILTIVMEPYHCVRSLRLFKLSSQLFLNNFDQIEDIEIRSAISDWNSEAVWENYYKRSPLIDMKSQAVIERCLGEKKKLSWGW